MSARKLSHEMTRVLRHMRDSGAICAYSFSGFVQWRGAHAPAPSIATIHALRCRGLLRLCPASRTWSLTDDGLEAPLP